jgi:UDP-N-acetylglucosamine 3-dehydrogenase
MARLRVGVIGVGSIGDKHLAGYAQQGKSVEIAALVDINGQRLKAMAEKYEVSAQHCYHDYQEMLEEENLDAVSICTPNILHFPMAQATIGLGLSTLIEKPMVLDPKHAQALGKLADKTGAKVMVAFSHRFIRCNMAGRKAIKSGLIGDPFMIRVRYAHSGPFPGWAQGDWFYDPKQAGGGALLDMGIHAIDIVQHLIGPIHSVQAEVRTLRKPIKVDDNAVILCDFGPKKCLGYIECGWTSGPGFIGIEVYGPKGMLNLDLEKPPVARVELPAKGGRPAGDKLVPLSVGKGLSHWPLQMESWVKHLQGKSTEVEIPGIAAGTSSLAVALAATESSKTGKRVKLKVR